MGLKALGLGLKKVLPALERQNFARASLAPHTIPANFSLKGFKLDTVAFKKMQTAVKQVLNKDDVITKFCSEQGLPVDDVIKQFDDVAQHLDDVAVERLLKLTNEGKINLI